MSCVFASRAFSQADTGNFFIRGRIIDFENKPIPYANIGVKEKDIGTVSNASGDFELKIPKKYRSEKLEISSIGYQSQILSMQELTSTENNKYIEIKLATIYQQLQDVVIIPKEFRTRVLGNTTTSKFLSGGFSSNDMGAEAGTRIKIKKPSYLKKVNFNLSYNKLDSIKVRLNIYAMHNGKPGENILPENIFININNKQTGNITIDLSKYDLLVKDDILIALQMIEAKGDVMASIFISSSLLGSPTYYREASQATWREYKSLSIGINVTVECKM